MLLHDDLQHKKLDSTQFNAVDGLDGVHCYKTGVLVRYGMQTLLHLISQGTQGVTSQRCEGSQEGCRTAKVCRTSTGRVAPEKSNAKANGTAPRPMDGMQAIVKQVPLNDRTTSTSAA